MSLDRRTRAFLRLADENSSLANDMLKNDSPPLRWVAVIAFYAAVHYVGAYIWEHDRREVPNHEARDNEVHRDLNLKAIAPNYLRLFDHGFKARYKAYYKADRQQVSELVRVDLAAIETCVKRTLNDL